MRRAAPITASLAAVVALAFLAAGCSQSRGPNASGTGSTTTRATASTTTTTVGPVGTFVRHLAGGQSQQIRLAIDIADCIGCDMCVAHCAKGVLTMVDSKALVNLNRLNDCDLDGRCVEVCPTRVVSLGIKSGQLI